MSAVVTERQIDEAAHAALAALYFADNSDYQTALWDVLRHLRPSLADLLERNGSRAYDLSLSVIESYPSPPGAA